VEAAHVCRLKPFTLFLTFLSCKVADSHYSLSPFHFILKLISCQVLQHYEDSRFILWEVRSSWSVLLSEFGQRARTPQMTSSHLEPIVCGEWAVRLTAMSAFTLVMLKPVFTDGYREAVLSSSTKLMQWNLSFSDIAPWSAFRATQIPYVEDAFCHHLLLTRPHELLLNFHTKN
jgi:hypothetical protein